MPEAHGIWLILTTLLGFIPLETFGQVNCDLAPFPAARIVCEQLLRWDIFTRAEPRVSAIPQLPPLIPGQPTPFIGAELAAMPMNPYQCMDLGCLCGFMGGNGQTGSNACTLPNGRPLFKARRREYRTLSDDERQRYHAAVLALKRNGEYDNIARIHSQFASGGAHSGPSFLPWHREFTKRFEIAIRMIDPTLSVPYWDSTLDRALPSPTDSIMFSDAFMGMNDAAGNVVTGPFAGWRTLSGRPNILRRIGAQGMLFSEQNINYVANANNINQVLAFTAPRQGCPVQIDWNALEYSHGNVHIWVGGDMMAQSTSANDPIFFLFHSFVDFIWEMFRQNRQDRFSRESDYPMDHPQCSSYFHFGSASMSPFEPWRNIDGLSNKYTDNLYEYDPRPQCPFCGGSQYLFCDRSHGAPRCASKIRIGGNCQGFISGEYACYNGYCVGGRCVGGPSPQTARQPTISTQRQTSVVQNCFNENECCGTWAAKGQCWANPSYMSQWCKVACGLCKPNYAMTECNDRHTKCGAWARSGECTRNPDWMAENCRSSCYKCGVTRAAKCGDIGGRNPTPIARRRPAAQPALVQCNPVGCFNENICCPFWGQQGQCAANAAWMSCNCRVTCGICRPQYAYGTCADYHLSCRQWAVIGECQKNPWMLENCRTSCRTCLNANQLRQRCQGGGRGRRRGRSADARSAFDINFNDIEISQGMPSINFTERNFRL